MHGSAARLRCSQQGGYASGLSGVSPLGELNSPSMIYKMMPQSVAAHPERFQHSSMSFQVNLLLKMLLQRLAQLKSTRHYFSSYIWVNFIIGLPFVAYGTYVIFQLQQIGFIIGHGVDEPTCMTSCIVPFGSSELDMNAVILYLNGMGFAFGGFIMIFVAALGDYWSMSF